MDVDVSLEWIGFGGRPTVDLATLAQLQRFHMNAVPFENLDIALGTEPAARYRFERVDFALADFAAISAALQRDDIGELPV